ncbi:MAG: ribonuclease HI [Actinomycetaceae bacterium]|nr:ribonuclease HI [Actinomycetaceae bacterium]
MNDDLFSAAGFDFDGDGSAPSVPASAVEVVAGSGSIGKIKPGYDMIIATDGACSGNPGPGGWAWVEQISGTHASGGASQTTNNIMELTALIEGLTYAGPQCDLLIRSDSQYSLNVMTTWAKGWRKRGWKKADKKPVANLNLVKRLLELYENRTGRTDVEWVKGHAGDEANEMCDRLAVEQSRLF